MQETNFRYEIIIHDDASTDSTPDIVREYANKYPDLIVPLFQSENQYSQGKRILARFLLPRARGKYVALCEGDDFWIDKYKLEKQVSFLESHPEYVLVGTNAFRLKVSTGEIIGLLEKKFLPFDFDTRALMIRNYIPTLTAVFRNGLIRQFPEIYFTGTGGDRRLYILLSQYGKCRFLPDVTGAYRLHANSSTGKRNSTYEGRKSSLIESIRNAERWNDYFGGQYQNEVELVREKASRELLFMALRHRDIRTALEFCDAVDQRPLYGWKSRIILLLLKAFRHTTAKLCG